MAQDELTQLQIRTIRVAVQTTMLALLAATAFFFLSELPMKPGPFVVLFISVTVATGLVTLLPWQRLFAGGLHSRTQYAWTAAMILLITLGVWVTGGEARYMSLLYALPTVFFAVSFTPRVHAFFLVFMFGSNAIAMGLTRWDAMSMAMLAILASLASFLSSEFRRQMAVIHQARLDSERRWGLVAAVAAAARNMSTVEPREVLFAVVEAIAGLGYPVARIYVKREAMDAFDVVAPRTGGTEEAPVHDWLPAGMRRRVLEAGRSLLVNLQQADDETATLMRELEVSSVAAVPIRVAGATEAVLVVGAAEDSTLSSHDLEVFRMLAAQASLALENADRFERQRHELERVAELERLRTDFLSSVSHELRTPLTVIKGIGLTLHQQWAHMDDDLRLEFLGRLNANAGTLDTLITTLLDFSRLEAGHLQVETEDVDLSALLDHTVERLSVLFAQHNVEVPVEGEIVVRADPVLLERIVENLLSNAAKHTPPGTRIQLSAEPHGPDAVITVGDEGKGIPPEDLEHLGERFFRGGDPLTRPIRGTGLGLAFVTEILKMHDRELEVWSEVGVGSRFSFSLPLADMAVARAQASDVGQIADAAPDQFSAVAEGARHPQGTEPGERFETILTAARLGAEWALAAMYRDLNPRFLRYFEVRAPGQAAALASHVWREVAAGLHEFEGDEPSFRRWVFSLARARVPALHAQGTATNGGGKAAVEAASAGAPTEAALARLAVLPPDEADVLLLALLGDLALDDVATLTGRRPAAIRALQRRGLQKLSEEPVPVGNTTGASREGA